MRPLLPRNSQVQPVALNLVLPLRTNRDDSQAYEVHQLQLKIQGIGSHLLSGYGQIALRQGDYEQARAYFQEDARISDETGSLTQYHWTMARLGFAELRAGNITEARQIFVETARNFQKERSRIGVVYALEGMSNLYLTVGKVEASARLLDWADATREVIQDTRLLLEQADIDQDIATAVKKMGRAAFEEAYEKGREMSLEDAVVYALGGE